LKSLCKAFGVPPGVSQTSDFIATQILETPLGALLVGADSKGVCLIEYTDMRMLGITTPYANILATQFCCHK